MARGRKNRNKIDGWILLDKPLGLTSTQALGRVKRLFNPQKAGHAGTLDPLASGLLPLAFGEATKTVPFVMDGRKVYRFTIRWGAETDTDDAEGSVVERSEIRPSPASIAEILGAFTGVVMQVPPRFSAIKIGGERAYDLARDGEEVDLAARPVDIHRLDLVACPDAYTSVFEAECGKGTYVRALARDMGRRLGAFGHICALRRIVVGPFDEDDMVTLDELEAAADGAPDTSALGDYVMPVERALADVPELAVNRNDAARLRRGQKVLLRGRDAPAFGGDVYATCAGQLIALAEIDRGELHPRRVFNLDG